MHQGILHRIIALIIPLLFISYGSITGQSFNYWSFILVMTIIFGYTHFYVATIYQMKGIRRSPDYAKKLKIFLVLGIIAILFCQVLVIQKLAIPLGIFTIFYFITHVLLNEHAFLNRDLGIQISYPFILIFLLAVAPLFLSSLLHPSFFYEFDLTYKQIAIDEQRVIIAHFVNLDFLKIINYALVAMFFIFSPLLAWRLYGGLLIPALCATIGIGIFAALTWLPVVNFVYILHLILVSHFILLTLIFINPIKKRGAPSMHQYIIRHLTIAVPLIVIAAYGMLSSHDFAEKLFTFTFEFTTFLTISVVHITVSLLNEPWFRKIFQLTN